MQLHQRLAHQRAAHAEMLGQLLLTQPLAGRQLLREDGIHDPLRDLCLVAHSHPQRPSVPRPAGGMHSSNSHNGAGSGRWGAVRSEVKEEARPGGRRRGT